MSVPSLSENTKAVLLLTCPLSPRPSVSPLTLTEYNRLAVVLFQQGKCPADILTERDLKAMAQNAQLGDEGRLESLLNQRGKLGFFLEEWEQQGIWVISRGDALFPDRIKSHLQMRTPPLLFGSGQIELLKPGGLAIVGSRNVDQSGTVFAERAAEFCAKNMIEVISGGARGVDSIAISTATAHGGCALGILADSLLKKSLSSAFRESIASGKLLLLSPYHPKAGFSVGSAMGRNKLIYAQSDYTLVISSDFKKGGTWAGATEELKRADHRTIFVRHEPDMPRGNSELVNLGGIPWPPLRDAADLRQRLKLERSQTEKDSVRCGQVAKKGPSRVLQGSLLTFTSIQSAEEPRA